MLRHLIRTNPAVLLTRSLYPHVKRARIPASSSYPIVGHRTTAASFHSTPSRRAPPLIALLATILKSSTSLEFVRTAARIFLTFMPAIMITNHKSIKKLKYAHLHGIPKSEETVARVMKQIRIRRYLLYSLFTVPMTLLWGTIVASLEQTPLTGRWRIIVLSPEEEEEIAEQLAGPGWYSAVAGILATDGPAKIIPNTDWRYTWVNSTLRRLEATIPTLTNEPTSHECWFDEEQDHPPMPPPASYPLRPRPRASEYLRCFRDNICEGTWFKPPIPRTPHQIAGPPYSLLIVDKPESSNAFSYGFGPNGGGGIVVYSGFLDEILARIPVNSGAPTDEPKSWVFSLLRALFPSPPRRPTPTPEQTTELAILLAHELSHLVLSHHLESLSSTTVIFPGTISILMDVVRVFLFPVTMLFGPFVNDAVANLGKVGSGELVRVGELRMTVNQETEADIVSARLLAHAGFDARDAVRFWDNRSSNTKSVECAGNTDEELSLNDGLAMALWGQTHPVNERRVDALRQELARWENERQRHVSVSRSEQKN